MNVEIWLCAAAMLWFPGAALLRLLGPSNIGDRATRIALQFALGLAFWPVIFLWTSLFPLHWTSSAVRGLVIVAAVVAFFRKRHFRFVRHVTFDAVLLGIVLTVTGWTRLRAIAAVVLPPWVDSVHHTMLVRLFLMRGTVPASYEPFITGAKAFYHWGYHAIAAALCWFTGQSDPFVVAAIILSLGQFLNALAPLFVYAATLSLVRSRNAAVISAALAGLVSFYPAYYVSWGRYTHLTGVLLLLAWIVVASRLQRIRLRTAGAAAILAAGLTLVHVRLAFFAVAFTAVLMLAELIRKRRPLALLVAGVIACAILSPWLVQIRKIAGTALAPGDSDARWTSPAEVRANLLWVPHTAELLSAATAGLSGLANIGPLGTAARVASFAWWLAIVIAVSRRSAGKRRRAKPLLWTFGILSAWCVLTLLFLRLTHLQFATNTSAAITVFVPICMAAGALIAWVVAPFHRAFVALAVAGCALIGIMTLSNVINPATVIATDADVAALRWVRASTAHTAALIGRVQPWYGGAFIGVDGAYWASVLADRRSLPPPSLYGWSGEYGAMELFMARWRDEYPFVTRTTMEEARRLGVTHVYFGRGTPSEAAPRAGTVVYSRDGISIAALSPRASARGLEGWVERSSMFEPPTPPGPSLSLGVTGHTQRRTARVRIGAPW